jgi:GntR family transcriptional regulator, histidine utilization repressor
VSGYRSIKQELLRRMQTRQWRAGDPIPGEVELAAEFGVARATMNRALRELSDEGIIERKRHAGSRVAALPVRQARVEIPLVRLEIEATGARYAYRLLARTLECRADMPNALFLHCLHAADTTPYMVEQRWINLDVVPAAETADFAAINPNEWLVEAMPFTQAEFAFSAANADTETAWLLDIAEGTALFVSQRTTWLGNRPITTARMAFGKDYRLTTRI